MLWPSPRDARLDPIILVLFRGAVLPAAARGFTLFAALTREVRVLGFVLTVFDFAVFAFDETLRETFEAALFEFLRGAIFLRELFFLVFFLVAMAPSLSLWPDAIHLHR